MKVRAIRGAITVDANTAEEISLRTRQLLKRMEEDNSLHKEDLISIILSVTSDINASFPASAAREAGYGDIPLMCTNEIDVPGSLRKCIRIMLHFNTDKSNTEVRHVYMRGARTLRPEYARIAITIDGPGGVGKSTVARAIAKRLGITYLDTGAMYRAFALKALRSGIGTKDRAKLAQLVNHIDLSIEYKDGNQKVILDKKDVSTEIRLPEVSVGASDVSAVPEVRLKMVELQRRFARSSSIIMDGRDTGTYVLPNADYKFYLVADINERARRRYKEQINSIPEISMEDVVKDLEYRDNNDSRRQLAPLSKAEDAVEIDTTDMTVDEVVGRILEIVNR